MTSRHDSLNDPHVTFFSLFPNAPEPRRADRSLFGSVPVRAYQHCEPMTSASAFGWYIFPPIDFMLKWDGTDILWKVPESKKWESASAVVLPGFASLYKRFIPSESRLQAPFPFLLARREPGLIQIWPGVLIRSQPGWSTLVRGPVNLPRSLAYEVLEGIIETDWWFGPLISTIRLCQTDSPIVFRTDRPLFQLQPVHSMVYASKALDRFDIMQGLSSLRGEDWKSLENTIYPDDARPGIYAARVRRRRKNDGNSG